jgi:hypothetical protein
MYLSDNMRYTKKLIEKMNNTDTILELSKMFDKHNKTVCRDCKTFCCCKNCAEDSGYFRKYTKTTRTMGEYTNAVRTETSDSDKTTFISNPIRFFSELDYGTQIDPIELKKKYGFTKDSGFLGKDGCKLPRCLRSIICQTYSCGDMNNAIFKEKNGAKYPTIRKMNEIRKAISDKKVQLFDMKKKYGLLM